MPPVIVQNGVAYLVHPRTGHTVAVPEADAADALAAGFTPAAQAGFEDLRRGETYGGAGGKALSALAGAGRGLTFGLSDLALTKAGLVAPETLAQLKAENPSASLGGEIAGTVGGMFIPGGQLGVAGKAGLAVKGVLSPARAAAGLAGRAIGAPMAKATAGTARLGELATAGAARALGKSETAIVPRLAGAVAREGTMGAALGAGGAISDIALAPQELSPDEILAHLAAGAGRGVLFGAGLGAVTTGVGAAARAWRKKQSFGLENARALRAERNVLQSERAAAEASGAQPARLQEIDAQIEGVGAELSRAQWDIAGSAMKRTISYAVGHVLSGGMAGGLIGMLAAPGAINAAVKALRASGATGEVIASKAGEVLSKVGSKLVGKGEKALVDALYGAGRKAIDTVSPYLGRAELAAENALTPVARQGARAVEFIESASPVATKAIESIKVGGEKVARAVKGASDAIVSTQGLGDAMAGAIVGGLHFGVPGAVLGAAGGFAANRLAQVAEITAAKMARAGGWAGFRAADDGNWRSLGQELGQSDPQQIEAQALATMPQGMPPDVSRAVIERATRAIDHLRQALPDAGKKPTAAATVADARIARAVIDPESVLAALSAGKLQRDQVQAWGRVYPEALAELRAHASAEVARAQAQGIKHSPQQLRQFAVLGVTALPKTQIYSPQAVARMQAVHAGGGGKQQPKMRPGGAAKMKSPAAAQTMTQQLASRR